MHQFKIIHISETFLNNNITSSLVSIPNYNMYRRDRVGKQGGGLISYVHSSLIHSPLPDLDTLMPETLSIKISPPHSKPFITMAIYRPPNTPVSWTQKFDTLISNAKQTTDEIIILGDFNLDLNQQNKRWSNTCQQLGLKLLIDKPTRVQQSSSSLIDHVYTSRPHNIIHSGVLEIAISDHFLIFATRKIGVKLPSGPNQVISYVNWNKFVPVNFQRDIAMIDWQDIYLCHNAEAMLDTFQDRLCGIINCHLKLKTRHVKTRTLPPWMDQEVLNHMKQRDTLKRKKTMASLQTATKPHQ